MRMIHHVNTCTCNVNTLVTDTIVTYKRVFLMDEVIMYQMGNENVYSEFIMRVVLHCTCSLMRPL